MLVVKKVNASDPDFRYLVSCLDLYLKVSDGDDHAFFDQFNHLDDIKYAVVAYENDFAVGCGAIKHFDAETMEVKRMFVLDEKRGRGIATQILVELEKMAISLGYKKCILETGKIQKEAVALYMKNEYKVIPNYGQYAGVELSVCFEKMLVLS